MSNLSDHTVLPNATYITIADLIVGGLYVISFVVGVFGNSLAWLYFWSKARDLPTLLYLLTAVNDVFLCALHLASGISMFYDRAGMWFDSHIFCTIWDVSHFVAVKLSVMLVLVLCVSRAWAVFRPLNISSEFRRHKILLFLFLFGVMVIAVDQSQRFLGWGESTYVAHDVYCWMTAVVPNTTGDTANLEVSNEDKLIGFYLFGAALLALPIIPVTVASIITITNMTKSMKKVKSNKTGTHIKRQATLTTIIFGMAYIVFNIPLFVNYVVWTFTLLWNLVLFDKIYVKNVPIFMFAWNWTDVLCVSLNCMVNPIIYYWRISGFRKWTNEKLMFWRPNEWAGPNSTRTSDSVIVREAGGRNGRQRRGSRKPGSVLRKQYSETSLPVSPCKMKHRHVRATSDMPHVHRCALRVRDPSETSIYSVRDRNAIMGKMLSEQQGKRRDNKFSRKSTATTATDLSLCNSLCNSISENSFKEIAAQENGTSNGGNGNI